MNHLNNIPSFDSYFTDLHCGLSDLPGQTYKFSVSGQQPEYQGMSVQTLNAPFPVYHNQPDIHKSSAGSFNSLNKYTINSSTLAAPTNTSVNDIPEIPQSALDEYVPWNSDNERDNYTLPSTSDIPFIQQVCLSRSEPEIKVPTPESYLIPGDKLTHFPVIPYNPQDLRPTTVVNPLSLNHTTCDNQTPRAKGIVDGNSPIVKRKQDLRNNPACSASESGHQRKRYKRDPEHAERQREYKKMRYKNDPEHAERQREYQKMRYKNDPEYAERQREYQRMRYKNDPDFVERIREYQKKLRQTPAYRAKRRLRQRERRKDPAYLERERERRRQRHKDPAYAKRQRERIREWRMKRRKDPAHVEHDRELIRNRQKDTTYSESERSAKVSTTSMLPLTREMSISGQPIHLAPLMPPVSSHQCPS